MVRDTVADGDTVNVNASKTMFFVLPVPNLALIVKW
jgi:hypothetical protein